MTAAIVVPAVSVVTMFLVGGESLAGCLIGWLSCACIALCVAAGIGRERRRVGSAIEAGTTIKLQRVPIHMLSENAIETASEA